MEIDDSESTSSISAAFISLAALIIQPRLSNIQGMLSESSMPISVAYSDHLDRRLETQQNTPAPAPFDPRSAIIIQPIIMWRLGWTQTLLRRRYPLFRSPLSNIILIYPPI